MTFSTMAEYYTAQNILPTEAKLSTPEAVNDYIMARRKFLNDKLYLPRAIFQGAELIEYGPDSGENALVWAQMGARCTLVEPNIKAHETIRALFYDNLYTFKSLETDDIASYASKSVQSQYDFVDAEGFIYTVQPSALWLDLFSRLLKPGGFALISYYETFGSFVELFTKMVYHRVVALGLDGKSAANTLFSAKWATVSHTRTIEQWTMDVLENPFVRLKYFLTACALVLEAEQHGLRLYSSWPQYRNGLAVRWHKSPEPNLEMPNFLERQKLSYMLGMPLLLAADTWRRDFEGVLSAVDACIDSDAALHTLYTRLTNLQLIVKNYVVYGDVFKGTRILKALAEIVRLLQAGDIDGVIHACRTNEAWLGAWGMPNQFAVFQKE